MAQATTETAIFKVKVPKTTSSYSPISNKSLVEAVLEELDKRKLKVIDKTYKMSNNEQQLFANMTIKGGDKEQNMSLGFRNSYNKTLPVGIVSGTSVIVCSNLMFKGDFKQMRKHTSGVKRDLEQMISDAVDQIERQYGLILNDSKKMKEVEVDEKIIAHLLGEMFYQEEIITGQQLHIIKNELKDLKNFDNKTIWDIMNHTTEALKVSHPADLIDDHIATHNFFLNKVTEYKK